MFHNAFIKWEHWILENYFFLEYPPNEETFSCQISQKQKTKLKHSELISMYLQNLA